jgi:hypothetical protein
MARTLFVIAALALVVLIIKNRIVNRRQNVHHAVNDAADNMVQCMQCHTYIPSREAVTSGEHTFCCKQHLRDWQIDQN